MTNTVAYICKIYVKYQFVRSIELPYTPTYTSTQKWFKEDKIHNFGKYISGFLNLKQFSEH